MALQFKVKYQIKSMHPFWQTVVWLPQILEQRYEILFLWSWYNFSQDVYQKILLPNICLPFNHCFSPEKKSQNPENSYIRLVIMVNTINWDNDSSNQGPDHLQVTKVNYYDTEELGSWNTICIYLCTYVFNIYTMYSKVEHG